MDDLTAAGERVLQKAQQLLEIEEALREAAKPRSEPVGRVRLGVIESVVHSWLPALIREVAAHYPQIQIDLTVDTARQLREQFRQHRLDLLIQNDPLEPNQSSEKIVITPLCDYPLRWVGRPGLLPRSRLTREDLLRIPLLTFVCVRLTHLFRES